MGNTVANTAVTQPGGGVPVANGNGAIQPTAATTTPAARSRVVTAVTRRTVAPTAAQPTAAAGVTRTSLRQPAATAKPPAPATKKPAQAPATTTTGTGGSK
jgi:hypothetical protein